MTKKILRLNHVGFKVDNQDILRDITFEVERGENIIIEGPSGSGKSTLLKLIASLNKYTSGEIYYKDKEIYDYEVTTYRQKVSYFFQNALLFDETVRDNLSFPYRIRHKRYDEKVLKESLERVQLPANYLDKPVKDLSGGEKQRVAFVRNLQYLPEILLLDEVTSALDAENSRIIHGLIQEMVDTSEVTILMVTHNKQEINQASRLITIMDGRVVE